MKTQYFTATSLDGYLATEEDSLDWLFPLGTLESNSYAEFISEVGALAMGSVEEILQASFMMQDYLTN